MTTPKNRRQFLAAGAALAAHELTRNSIAAEVRDGRSPVSQKDMDAAIANMFKQGRYTCVRTAEANDGPFYYESSRRRRDIAEGRKGAKLKLIVNVANATFPGDKCAPLEAAVVDVWHADAEGTYSNAGPDVQMLDTRGATFMRGHQVTSADGRVEFDTVIPGWELVTTVPPLNMVVRATHIHMKVFHENKIVTTQLYFPDEFLDELYASTDPYRTHRQMTAPALKGRMIDRIRNTDDIQFSGGQMKPMTLAKNGDTWVAEATIGVMTIGSLGRKSMFR